MLSQNVLSYIEENAAQAYHQLLELSQLPAPSGQEERRAAYCKQYLDGIAAPGVYVDDALNVVYPIGDDGQCPLMVFFAHSDVVFPDTDALPLTEADGKIFCPGVGDDTANVAALMLGAKYLTEKKLAPKDCGVLLVINSCEEGLGNLKGCRAIMDRYGHRVKEFVTFDGYAETVSAMSVGSRRFAITVETEGGHSLSDFGNRNAIAYMASLIDTLYTMKVPPMGTSSYNVGTVTGGTSVNTIAQNATITYEFRSDNREALELMQKHLDSALAFYSTKGITVTCKKIGDRPCRGDVDEQAQAVLTRRAAEAIESYYGFAPGFRSMSTDCNIPLSMGIPSVCVACCRGAGAHTREEFVYTDSLLPGLKVCLDMILTHF